MASIVLVSVLKKHEINKYSQYRMFLAPSYDSTEKSHHYPFFCLSNDLFVQQFFDHTFNIGIRCR